MAKKVQANPTSQERLNMIAEAAYFIAQNRGFSEGNPEQDWYTAEKEIDRFIDEQSEAVIVSKKSTPKK